MQKFDLYDSDSDRYYPAAIEVSTVDNGGSYPGSFTKKEIEWIEKEIEGKKTLHLFSGSSTLGIVRVDFAHPNATHKMDVFDYLQKCTERFDVVLLDPPYNERFAEKYNHEARGTYDQFVIFADSKRTTILWDLICKKLRPFKIIMKSWNYYIPQGYKAKKVILCYAGGFRKPTIFEILVKKEKDLFNLLEE